VEKVRPLVDVVGPGFDVLVPSAFALETDHAARRQHAHDLAFRDLAGLLHDNEVDEIVCIGQGRRREGLNGDRAVQTLCLDIGPGLLDVGRIGIESVNREAIVGAQCGG